MTQHNFSSAMKLFHTQHKKFNARNVVQQNSFYKANDNLEILIVQHLSKTVPRI